MKKVFICILLFLPAQVFAKWVDMKMPYNFVYYEDKKLNINEIDGKKKISGWIMNSLTKSQKIQNKNFLSAKQQFNITCNPESLSYNYTVYYSGANGSGDIQFIYEPNLFSYSGEVIVPDSFEEFYLDFFCKKLK